MSSTNLQGHAASVYADLLRELATGKFPHGILLAGPEGVGKATLANALARKLLGEDDATAARIAAGSHTDLLVVAPLYDEKKEAFKEEISAEQTRHIPEFLSLTAGEGAWRVVIVDGAELMTNAAANAILKILEEPPPQAVLILVSHQAGRLLPTIRSRCRTLKIAPLSEADFMQIVRAQLPEIGKETARELGALTDFSAGRAIEYYHQGALDMLGQLRLIFEALPSLPHERVLAMAEQVMNGNQHRNFALFAELMLYIMADKARAESSEFWAEKWQSTANELSTAHRRHLDYKSTVIATFHSLAA